MLERARNLAQRLEGDAGVERRRIELLVPEQHLDHANVGLLFEQVRGKAVPQRVQMDGLSISAIRAAAWQARLS